MFQCYWAAAMDSLDLDHEGYSVTAMEGPGNAYWQRGWWRGQSSCLLRNAASQPELSGKNFLGQHLLVSMEDASGTKCSYVWRQVTSVLARKEASVYPTEDNGSCL